MPQCGSSKKSRKSMKSRKRKNHHKGGGYGSPMNSLHTSATGGMGRSYAPAVPYQQCDGQQGGGPAIFNNSGGYGYTHDGAGFADIAKGGHFKPTPYTTAQCGAGKRKKTSKNMRSRKHHKSRKSKTLKSKKRLRKCRCKGKCRCKKTKHTNKKRSRKYKKSKKHHQKGGSIIAPMGYSQYSSNTPIGASYQTPATHAPLPALAPNSFEKTEINCNDNYNHFKK